MHNNSDLNDHVRSENRGIRHHLRAANQLVPTKVWTPAIDAGGGIYEGGDVAEFTRLLDLSRWPDDMRVIVRRERSHPGTQLSLFDEPGDRCYQAFVTSTTMELASPEARHRANARIEGRIGTRRHRCGPLPS